MQFAIFIAEKNLSSLHGQVFVMFYKLIFMYVISIRGRSSIVSVDSDRRRSISSCLTSFFLMQFPMFTVENNLCVLHWQVFVMFISSYSCM